MEYRSFLARNAEHLIAGIHLWCWIYYDLTSIFPLKAPPIGLNSMILNSTSHGMVCKSDHHGFLLIKTRHSFTFHKILFILFQMCLLLLVLLRTLKNVQLNPESKLMRLESFSTFAIPFAIHFLLSMFIINRIDQELILPKMYEYISPK